MGKEFDNFIKSKFDERPIEFRESHWEDALALIEANTTTPKPLYLRFRFWLAILAGMLFLGLTYYGLQYYFDKPNNIVLNSGLPGQDTQANQIETAALADIEPEKSTSSTLSSDTSSKSTSGFEDGLVQTSSLVSTKSTLPSSVGTSVDSSEKNDHASSKARQRTDDTPKTNTSEIGAPTLVDGIPNRIEPTGIQLTKQNTGITTDENNPLDNTPLGNIIASTTEDVNTDLQSLPIPTGLLETENDISLKAQESPEVLGTASLPGVVNVAAIGGLGSYGNWSNVGMQFSLGGMLHYAFNDAWAIKLAPQLYSVKRFDYALEERTVQSYSFGAETNAYSLKNDWQFGIEMPIAVALRIGANQELAMGPTLRWNIGANGVLENNVSTSFDSKNVTEGSGRIDPQLYEALNMGLHFSYHLHLNRKSSLILFGNQYINPFWRTDSTRDVALGVMYSYRLF